MKKNSIYIMQEIKGCFDFFWNEAEKDEMGFGLIPDRTRKESKNISSMAATGFGLSAYVIGVERNFVTHAEAKERVLKTLKTLEKVPHYKGFLAHFVNMKTCERLFKCEFSTIDTALLLNGILTVESYFKDEEISKLAKNFYERIDWLDFVKDYKGRKVFCMSYNPDVDGAYREKNGGSYIFQWHMPAEQLMMYFLAAGQENFDSNLAQELYFGFDRYLGSYKNHSHVFTPGGTLFTYQFSHAWFDFENYVDCYNFDWFANSREATLANREWCIDHKNKFKTFNENAWGLSASVSPTGYAVNGTFPCYLGNGKTEPDCEGTIPPYSPISSIIFTPEESLNALNYFYENHPQLLGKYGLTDAYNLEGETPWYCEEFLGLDKGITILMLDNYLSGTTHKYYMSHPFIQRAIKKLNFHKK